MINVPTTLAADADAVAANAEGCKHQKRAPIANVLRQRDASHSSSSRDRGQGKCREGATQGVLVLKTQIGVERNRMWFCIKI